MQAVTGGAGEAVLVILFVVLASFAPAAVGVRYLLRACAQVARPARLVGLLWGCIACCTLNCCSNKSFRACWLLQPFMARFSQ
jgi:hypothetical protein